MSDPITTAFHAVQQARGATFMEEGGWLWSVSFGDPAAEYAAVREGVGMWDVSPLNKWEFRGPDAVEAAQRVHSNDILGLEVGQVRYGAFLDEDGLLVDDGTVFKHADDHLWVMTNGMDHAEYFAEATKGLDVSVDYIALELPNLQIQGPRSRELLRSLTDVDLDALRYFHFIPEPVTVGGVPVWLSRTGFSGELGFELFLRPEHATDLWEAVESAGATPYGVEVIEPLRIETGMVVTDYDYAAHERSPFDLGMDRLVALETVAEFMGKERLREIAADPPNRFKTLRVEGDTLPEYGASVTRDGEDVGVLTSPAISPTLGNIGLAILRTDASADGSAVDVALGDGTVLATVDVAAIYDPQKRRPRS
jgi:aminomethyltransferase